MSTVTTISSGITGDLAISAGMVYYLTTCCKASAKGCADYVGCRACYREIDARLGDAWMADDASGWARRIAFLMDASDFPADLAESWVGKEAARARELASRA